jgi:hypothetical protein
MLRNRIPTSALSLVAISSLLILGCGPSIGVVSGTVTIDGQPVSGGVISYVPADGAAPPATSNIEGGKYEVRTMAGKKFVQISAPHVVGKRKEYEGPDAPLVEITDERLPAKYNSQTELTFEVKPGANKQDWDLKLK